MLKVITKEDLFFNPFTKSQTFIIKGCRFLYQKEDKKIAIHKKETLKIKYVNCISLKKFVEFLNQEHNKAYFNDKFKELINE